MGDKHMKRCSIPLVIKEMQIKSQQNTKVKFYKRLTTLLARYSTIQILIF